MGRALFQAHRRDDRRAEDKRRAGAGSACVDPRRQVDKRHGYLDELYRARAEKAGIVYVESGTLCRRSGRYAQQGPDFEGQTRRLRTYDGVNFTKAGAEKLVHYVEHELRRV